MPGGLTLLQSAPSDIPTPGANKDTLFIDNTQSPNPAPAYKDSAGVVRSLLGLTGAQGPVGPMFPIEDGLEGESVLGIPGPVGPAGAAGGTSLTIARITLNSGQLTALNSSPQQMVAAPGASTIVQLIAFAIEVIVTVGFTNTPQMSLVYGTNATNLLATTIGFSWNLTGTYEAIWTPQAGTIFTVATFDIRNKAMNLKLAADLTGGGAATAVVNLAYTTITVA